MILYGTLFISAVALLLVATNFTVLLGEKLSRVWRISPLIVATTVVAIGTSLPELILSVTAVVAGDRGLALGNVVGSNVLNVFLVLPIAILFGNIRVGTKKTQSNAVILFVLTAIFIAFQVIQFPNIVFGLMLLTGAGVVTFYEYKLGVRGSLNEDIAMFIESKTEHFSKFHVLALIVALVWVIVSAITVVIAVENIAVITGLSTTVLGLTLTALATSLPELFVTISSRSKKREKIALGNLLGSNIYNLLLVAGLINVLTFEFTPLSIELMFLGLSTVLFVGLVRVYKGSVLPKLSGFMLLCGCMWYLWSVFM